MNELYYLIIIWFKFLDAENYLYHFHSFLFIFLFIFFVHFALTLNLPKRWGFWKENRLSWYPWLIPNETYKINSILLIFCLLDLDLNRIFTFIWICLEFVHLQTNIYYCTLKPEKEQQEQIVKLTNIRTSDYCNYNDNRAARSSLIFINWCDSYTH